MYCRHCGREVVSENKNCFYCGLGLTRPKKARRCPFCSEEIQADAVKCKHCGEFVDPRFRQTPEGDSPAPSPPSATPQAQNVQIFVIDKALVRSSEDLRLAGGQPVPPELARRLPPAAVQAIEANAPQLLPEGPVAALPPPAAQQGDESGLVDVDARTVELGMLEAPPAGPHMLPAPAEGPLDWKERGRRIVTQVGRWVGRAALFAARQLAVWLWWLLRWTGRKGRERWRAHRARKQAEREARRLAAETPEPQSDWYDCPHCQTEVHRLDNYCYLCGNRLRKDAPPRPTPGKPRPDAPTSKAAQIAFVFALFGLVPLPPLNLPAALVGVLFAIIALANIERARPRIKGLGLAMAALAMGVGWLALIELHKRGRVHLPLQPAAQHQPADADAQPKPEAAGERH